MAHLMVDHYRMRAACFVCGDILGGHCKHQCSESVLVQEYGDKWIAKVGHIVSVRPATQTPETHPPLRQSLAGEEKRCQYPAFERDRFWWPGYGEYVLHAGKRAVFTEEEYSRLPPEQEVTAGDGYY